MSKPKIMLTGFLTISTMFSALTLPTMAAEGPWPADVPGHKPLAPGEHPRLLFRKSDLPELKARMNTPEGKLILQRLRVMLDGKDGTSLPENPTMKGRPGGDGSGPLDKAPIGSVQTFSHVAGYGMLYQLTGDKRYADLARKAMDLALEGYRDRDQRYSFRQPYGALRAGPSIGWYALGFDLACEGWDADYRKKVAQAFANYNEGQWCSIEELTAGKRQHPGSNHWGMQVGGAALALLAIMGEPGVDDAKIKSLLKISEQSMITNMTKGFGDGGFFAEGDGTGSMSSHIVFLTALQAWKTAAGKDFISPRPNAQWLAFRWFLQTQSEGGKPVFQPQRGGYPHNIWQRNDISGGGYFSIGMGVSNDDQKSALAWYYDRFGFKDADLKAGTPYDAVSAYPHHAILSYVNWPIGKPLKPMNGIIPNACRDSKWGFYAWRNRWQDQDDVIITILTKAAKGNMGAAGENTLSIVTRGKLQKWGTIKGFTDDYSPRPDGTTVLTTGDGSSLAIDFTKASGADVMLVMTGPGAPAGGSVEAGGVTFSFLFLGAGKAPTPQAQGNKVVVGGQTVSFDGKKIVLAK
jgi:hypothetical protein